MSGPKHLWSGDWERESAALSDELAERGSQPENGRASAPPAPRVWAAPRQAAESPPEREAPAQRARRRRRRPAVTRSRPRWLSILPVALVAALILAGAGYGLSALLGSSHGTTRTAQTQASARSPSTPRSAVPRSTAPVPPYSVPRATPPPAGSPTTPPSGGAPVVPQAAPPTTPPPGGAPVTPSTPYPATPPSGGTPTPPASTPVPVSWLGMQLVTVPPGAVVVETVAPASEAALARLEPGDVILAVNGQRVTATRDIRRAISGLRRGVLISLEVSRGSTLFTTQAAMAAPPSP